MNKVSFFVDKNYLEVDPDLYKSLFIRGDYNYNNFVYVFDNKRLNNYLEFRYSFEEESLIEFKVKNKSYKQSLIKLFLGSNSYINLYDIDSTDFFKKIAIVTEASNIRIYSGGSLSKYYENIYEHKGIHVGDCFDGIFEIIDLRVFLGLNSPLRKKR